jgi:hypothetical protein
MSHRLATVAALVLLFAAPASASTGASCAHPAHWKLSRDQVSTLAGVTSARPLSFHNGSVQVAASDDDPFAAGPRFRFTAHDPVRICAVHGHYATGHTWELRGTLGAASFAERRFGRRSSIWAPLTMTVTFAHRAASDGSSCDNPHVMYAGGPDGTGDTGARIRSVETFAGGKHVLTAQWQLAIGSHLCRVSGASTHGQPWAIADGGDGEHVMHRASRVGNHDSPVLFLWIWFRR